MDRGCTEQLAGGVDMENTETTELGSQGPELSLGQQKDFQFLRICVVFTM